MNNKISLAAILMAVLCIMTSCLGGNDSSTTQYDDVAVTSFTLGTLKKIVYSKSHGKDTTYATTQSCSSVKFTIDNVSNKIYNVDSLTRGIVTSKALVSIGTKNGGYAYLKEYSDSSLVYISSTDSLDFSKPREVRIVANDGSWYKDYTVDVRVHQQPKDSVYWSKKAVNVMIGKLNDMRAICFSGKMIVYGTDDNAAFTAYSSPIDNGADWSLMKAPFSAKASIVTDGAVLYAYSAGKVYSSSDGEAWTEMGANADINALVVATKSELYAVANNGQVLVSNTGGSSWTEDAMADDKSLMPSLDLCGVVTTSTTNSDINNISIFGNAELALDGYGVMWSKIVDNSNNAHNQPWEHHVNSSNITSYKMPALSNMSITPYGGGLLMIGGDGRGACHTNGLTDFYLSQDNGLSWWSDSRFYFPSDFASDTVNYAFAVDSENYMWIFCGDTGQVWRGYLTQMVWKNN